MGTAGMPGGTLLLRGHIWLVLIPTVDAKQANVVIMLFFGKHPIGIDSNVPYLNIEFGKIIKCAPSNILT